MIIPDRFEPGMARLLARFEKARAAKALAIAPGQEPVANHGRLGAVSDKIRE